jgi:hypothetical protein
MNRVQQYLAGIGVDALAATLITRTLLGDESRSLGEAKRIVLTPARTRELAWHEDLMNNLDTLTGKSDDPDNTPASRAARRTCTRKVTRVLFK